MPKSPSATTRDELSAAFVNTNPAISKAHPEPPHTFLLGPMFLRNTLIGVFQYCATMLLVTFLSLCAWVLGIYNTDSFSLASAYTYLELLQSGSQCWALYCLVLFYQASKAKLRPIHPLNKFICIKMVVFFTFWQVSGFTRLQLSSAAHKHARTHRK